MTHNKICRVANESDDRQLNSVYNLSDLDEITTISELFLLRQGSQNFDPPTACQEAVELIPTRPDFAES